MQVIISITSGIYPDRTAKQQTPVMQVIISVSFCFAKRRAPCLLLLVLGGLRRGLGGRDDVPGVGDALLHVGAQLRPVVVVIKKVISMKKLLVVSFFVCLGVMNVFAVENELDIGPHRDAPVLPQVLGIMGRRGRG